MKNKLKIITYVVKIRVSYCTAVFEFHSIEEAGEFIKLAAFHNVKDEDTVAISMTIKEPEEGKENGE